MLVTWLFGGMNSNTLFHRSYSGSGKLVRSRSWQSTGLSLFFLLFFMLFLTVPRLFGGQGQVIKRKKACGNIHLNWKVTTNIVGAELRTILYQSIFVLIIFLSVFLSSNVMLPFLLLLLSFICFYVTSSFYSFNSFFSYI